MATSAVSSKALSVSVSGNNTIYTPEAGHRIKLSYLALSADGANSADVTVTVRFGSSPANYIFSLKAGSILARNIGAGNRHLQGGTDEPVVVSLSTNQTVHVSIEFDEMP